MVPLYLVLRHPTPSPPGHGAGTHLPLPADQDPDLMSSLKQELRASLAKCPCEEPGTSPYSSAKVFVPSLLSQVRGGKKKPDLTASDHLQACQHLQN